MNTEIQTFTNIWLTAAVSLIYCRQIASKIPGGAARFLSLLPIMYLFTTLPLPLPLTTLHLSAPTIFYLVWLANFKLLLFSFNQPPLISNPQLSLLHFTSIALLPIKPNSQSKHAPINNKPYISLFLKLGLLTAIVSSYQYRDSIHPYLIIALYSCHVYFGLELVLALTAAPVRYVLGLELEPQFNEPYLATSLQDFWGRRWNLMVTSILRPTVYQPVRRICTRVFGNRKWALPPAIFATFLVSGLMHEVVYYYLTRVSPTWEVTWFFVLHGVCVGVEVAVKKAVTDTWRLNRGVSRVMTVGFVVVTGGWLFFPQVIRNEVDLKAINEYYVLGRFVRDKLIGLSQLVSKPELVS